MIHAVKGCEILINDEDVEGAEPDSILFVPETAKLTLRNKSKNASAVMKVQLTVCENLATNAESAGAEAAATVAVAK